MMMQCRHDAGRYTSNKMPDIFTMLSLSLSRGFAHSGQRDKRESASAVLMCIVGAQLRGDSLLTTTTTREI